MTGTENLTIQIPISILRELTSLERDDLPPKLAIQLARQMYPWFDQLLQVLIIEAERIAKTRTDELFSEALFTVEKES
ncbi:MAG: hypothetical protein OXU51_16550 [Candidatus Poribacteria bacterium]|nr:hypothetical protein [Candidatus Poribacteria bacterium]